MNRGKTEISADLPSRAEGPAFLFSSASITSSGKPKTTVRNERRLQMEKKKDTLASFVTTFIVVVEQTADRKHVPQSTGLVSRLKKKYRFSFSHQEPKPWSKS